MLPYTNGLRNTPKALKNLNSESCKTIVIDEMWHFVSGKKTKFGSGKPMICYQKELLPGKLGSVIVEL
ncbi:MAG: hypothetical protein LBT03_02065 [Holosporales bacterium]|jgi:hypothetical protein|nr:hypothetical protein [Holosporales bacterium]